MISNELAARHYLPPIEKYHHPTRDWYYTFLCQSDYVTAKAMEAQLLGESIEDYTEVLEARKFAREQINKIDNGTYDGPEAGTNIDIYYPPELEDESVENNEK